MEIGKVIIGKDYKRFLIVKMPNGDMGLLDLQSCEVLHTESIYAYVSKYHGGIEKITDIVILNKC